MKTCKPVELNTLLFIKLLTNGPTQYTSKGNGFSISLPAQAQRWTITPDWDPSSGDFSEDEVNSLNVVMSATETASTNKTVLKYDPFVKKGISEDSMVNVVLPYIKSPRKGVQRLGEIVSQLPRVKTRGL